LPVDFSLQGYKAVFSHQLILSGYRNTILYTVIGTIINIGMTMIAAYPLSRRDMPFRGHFMFLFTFTMFFSGGLIPTYLLINNLHLIDKFWVMVIPGAISVFNMILTRTFLMSSIPNELLEASQIDGCSDARYFFHIILPLSKPVIAVIALYYAVGHWNSYFSALIYLNNRSLFPLQLVLRSILVMDQVSLNEINDPELIAGLQGLSELLKYSLIVVATVPILLVYPLAQKYFVTGVMIGSIKG
jgi:multiple sugar transport system permease protein/putative aldouronate transport system permease protein